MRWFHLIVALLNFVEITVSVGGRHVDKRLKFVAIDNLNIIWDYVTNSHIFKNWNLLNHLKRKYIQLLLFIIIEGNLKHNWCSQLGGGSPIYAYTGCFENLWGLTARWTRIGTGKNGKIGLKNFPDYLSISYYIN